MTPAAIFSKLARKLAIGPEASPPLNELVVVSNDGGLFLSRGWKDVKHAFVSATPIAMKGTVSKTIRTPTNSPTQIQALERPEDSSLSLISQNPAIGGLRNQVQRKK